MRLSCFALALGVAFGPVSASLAVDDYVPGPDSVRHEGVPQGELIDFDLTGSKVFPGTTHTVTVYVPKQYDPAHAACLFVCQDKLLWNANIVFDNLIARHELPVIIGVFITPGVVKTSDPAHALDRFNRSYEYDGLGDGYARFVLDEVLPAVESKTTSDGRPIHLSHSANDRAIGGWSSGAIAAFTVAWERPDAFARVFSAIGTYVDLRGGGRYPSLIRKFEPKPIRIFLQDGSNDLNIYGGDWSMANQTMERAFEFAGYEVNHVWGDGSHNGKHSTAIFPEAIRWLWHDWPQPVKAGPSKNDTLAALLIPGQDWELVGDQFKFTEGPAVNAHGEVFFHDFILNHGYRIAADGSVQIFHDDGRKANGATFGPDGRLYTVGIGNPQVIRYEPDGKATVLVDGLAGNDIAIAHNGNAYITDNAKGVPSSVVLLRPDGTKTVVDPDASGANGVVLSPDQSLLYVTDWGSHWVYSYTINPDGTLANKQRYYWLHVPDTADRAEADGIRVDREGRLYVATNLGIQVCDQAGRVQCILPPPGGRVANLVFGGEKFDTLYALCFDKVYRRKLNTVGVNNWDMPVKPPAPKL